jgi:hypothetical protein
MQFHITPHTTIMDILELYPGIEDFLISLVPPFEKLKNPALRNTLGKITTIEQAAKVGEISLPHLINALNEKLGLLPDHIMYFKDEGNLLFEVNANLVKQILDADEIISSGGKPVSIILGSLNKLQGNELLQLNCTFHPAPLIDKAKDAGYLTQEVKNPDMSISIYFKKP